MPSSTRAQRQGRARQHRNCYENVTNPFCGTLPDDLTVERTDKGLKVLDHGDGKSVAGFERKLPPSSPQVKGKDVDLAKAIEQAAKLIGKAKLPMYGGLATDVEGMRAVLALAERSSGIVDHAFSEAQYRNFRIVQTSRLGDVDHHRGRATAPTSSSLPAATSTSCIRASSSGSSRRRIRCSTSRRRSAPWCSSAKGSTVPAPRARASARSSRWPVPDEQAGEIVALLRARLRGFRVKPPKLDRRHPRRDRCAGRALPQRQIRRGCLGAAFTEFPLRRACRRSIRRPGEGPQPDHQICRARARRRRRRRSPRPRCAPGSAAIRFASAMRPARPTTILTAGPSGGC